MSLSEKFAELQELLLGLAAVAVVIAIMVWLMGMAADKYQNDDGRDKHLQPDDRNSKAGSAIPRRQPRRKTAGSPEPEAPSVAALFIAPKGGQPMERVEYVEVVRYRGIVGDRYYLENGHWSGRDECEVTIIAQEDIDEIDRHFDVKIQNGEHRRNLVIQNLAIDELTGKRFHIGTAYFGYERPRPPCRYIQTVSEPGMSKALGRRAGICVRCIQDGVIKPGDQIVIEKITLGLAVKYRLNLILHHWKTGKNAHE